MRIEELKFILNDSIHCYMIEGELQLVSDGYVKKRAVIELQSHFEMLPFAPGHINVVVAIDENFQFECNYVNLVDAKTIEFLITRTVAA